MEQRNMDIIKEKAKMNVDNLTFQEFFDIIIVVIKGE